MSKEVQVWADEAMFRAQSIDRKAGPRVFLLSANPDPLGSIAAAAKAYKGEFVSSLAEVTDDERRYYLTEVQKSVLAMPLESVHFHFRITGVTRGFTHQMVRQRTAAYSQESTRFAVKDDVPVGLPPSIQQIPSLEERIAELKKRMPPMTTDDELYRLICDGRSKEEQWRDVWDATVAGIEDAYNLMVNSGMPAEDARGILPTNLLTQINYITDLRGLKEHAGLRLCTQAQFEWRQVWAQIVAALREYGQNQLYMVRDLDGVESVESSEWQFNALADLFRPICYYRGSCQFQADFDRKCSIRDRVSSFAEHGIPSTEWETEHNVAAGTGDYRTKMILPIFPAEWLLDSSAAR